MIMTLDLDVLQTEVNTMSGTVAGILKQKPLQIVVEVGEMSESSFENEKGGFKQNVSAAAHYSLKKRSIVVPADFGTLGSPEYKKEILFHELVHAYHDFSSNSFTSPQYSLFKDLQRGFPSLRNVMKPILLSYPTALSPSYPTRNFYSFENHHLWELVGCEYMAYILSAGHFNSFRDGLTISSYVKVIEGGKKLDENDYAFSRSWYTAQEYAKLQKDKDIFELQSKTKSMLSYQLAEGLGRLGYIPELNNLTVSVRKNDSETKKERIVQLCSKPPTWDQIVEFVIPKMYLDVPLLGERLLGPKSYVGGFFAE